MKVYFLFKMGHSSQLCWFTAQCAAHSFFLRSHLRKNVTTFLHCSGSVAITCRVSYFITCFSLVMFGAKKDEIHLGCPWAVNVVVCDTFRPVYSVWYPAISLFGAVTKREWASPCSCQGGYFWSKFTNMAWGQRSW